MASAKEIQGRIKSIRNIRKITNATHTISSTKLKKSRKMLEETEPYFYTLQTLIKHVLRHMSEMERRYFSTRVDVKEGERTHGLIVITGDKGLTSAYNRNVLKPAETWMTEYENHRLYVVGELGRQYFTGRNIPVEEESHYIVQNPSMHQARLISIRAQGNHEQGLLDDVSILYARMANSPTMEAEMETLLPLKRGTFSDLVIPAGIVQGEIQMLPNPSAVMNNIVLNYLTGSVFGVLTESSRSEQNARMMVMQPASDNATVILNDLSTKYNRVRQAATAQGITEVISRAKSQRKRRR